MSYTEDTINNYGMYTTKNKKREKKNDNSVALLFFLAIVIFALLAVLIMDHKDKNKDTTANNVTSTSIEDDKTTYNEFILNENQNLQIAKEIETLDGSEDKKCYINGDLAWNIEISDGIITYTAKNERDGSDIEKTVAIKDLTEMYYDINGDGEFTDNESLKGTAIIDIANNLSVSQEGDITLKNATITNEGKVKVGDSMTEVGTYNSYTIYKHTKLTDDDTTYYYYKDQKGDIFVIKDEDVKSSEIAKNNGKFILNKQTEISLKNTTNDKGNSYYTTIYESGR